MVLPTLAIAEQRYGALLHGHLAPTLVAITVTFLSIYFFAQLSLPDDLPKDVYCSTRARTRAFPASPNSNTAPPSTGTCHLTPAVAITATSLSSQKNKKKTPDNLPGVVFRRTRACTSPTTAICAHAVGFLAIRVVVARHTIFTTAGVAEQIIRPPAPRSGHAGEPAVVS